MKKKIISIIIGLIVLQLLRIGLKELFFSFVERTLLTDTIISLSYMAVIGCGILIAAKKHHFNLSLPPKKFGKIYVIATIIVAAILISTPFITKNLTLYGIVALLYGAVVTPFYEEVIFRGFIWEYVRIKTDKSAYIISTALFAIWHLGYIDTILWRTSLFFPNSNIPEIMFWKVITGLVIGVVLGGVRYKTKNAYSSMLLHCLINTVGS